MFDFLSDTTTILQIIASAAAIFSGFGAFICKKIWEGVGVLKEILLRVAHLDKKLNEVHSRVVVSEELQKQSTTELAVVRVHLDDHERRLVKLELNNE
jgi:endonuclease/exonuclease/phosphatase family metal-dependent hydrolase